MRKKRTNLSILRLTRIVHASPDDGSAMIFVLAWSVVLVLLTLVVTQVAVQQIAPSDRSERSYAALAAAEAWLLLTRAVRTRSVAAVAVVHSVQVRRRV